MPSNFENHYLWCPELFEGDTSTLLTWALIGEVNAAAVMGNMPFIHSGRCPGRQGRTIFQSTRNMPKGPSSRKILNKSRSIVMTSSQLVGRPRIPNSTRGCRRQIDKALSSRRGAFCARHTSYKMVGKFRDGWGVSVRRPVCTTALKQGGSGIDTKQKALMHPT